MLFAFVSLLIALVVADNCQLEGHTYMNGDMSITFGTSVATGDSWIVQNDGAGHITLSSWSPVEDSTHWSTMEAWSSSGKLSCGSLTPPGEYDVTFSTDCATLDFHHVDDYLCDERRAFFAHEFTLVVPADCGQEGSSVTGRTSSGVATEIVFADDGYVLVTAGSDLSFHHWQTLGTDVQITSIWPAVSDAVGSYSVDWETVSCGLEICGISDPVQPRAAMLHDSKFNSYSGNSCPDWSDVDPAEPSASPCNNNGAQWNAHPYDCIYQEVEGGCAFCAGRVHGKDINICVARGGRKCNDIYNQIGTHTYCNLAFECGPASVVSFSVLLLVSCLVALFI